MELQFDPSRDEFEAFLDLQLGLVGLRLAQVSAEVAAVYPLLERQFACIRNKYYLEAGKPVVRLAQNAQYTIVLYLLSRALFAGGKRQQADRVYALLRMVSCVDLYYEVALPELWGCDHPLGSVIGRAAFGRSASLFFSQNCNIGNNRGIFPRIDGNLHMLPNSSLLGDTRVSGNVVLSNGTFVIDGGNLSDCIVFGRSPDLVVKPLSVERFQSRYPLLYSK